MNRCHSCKWKLICENQVNKTKNSSKKKEEDNNERKDKKVNK